MEQINSTKGDNEEIYDSVQNKQTQRPISDGSDNAPIFNKTVNEKVKKHQKGTSGYHKSRKGYEEFIPIPPDGGWGWLVVAAAFVCNMIVGGVTYAFGVLQVHLAGYFLVAKSKVLLIGSMQCGMILFVGPIVSASTNKFGCGPVMVCGSVLAAIAFLISIVSSSSDILIITYGGLGGLGLGMIYFPSIISVGYYFLNRRALATGIADSGFGIGACWVVPLAEYLLDEMDWKNALLIMAGIVLQATVCGLLIRPLSATRLKRTSGPRAKNIWDRMKETISTTRNKKITDPGTKALNIKQRVLEAKLRREKQLQEREMGSVHSLFLLHNCSADKEALSRDGAVGWSAGSNPNENTFYFTSQTSIAFRRIQMERPFISCTDNPLTADTGRKGQNLHDRTLNPISLLSCPSDPSMSRSHKENPPLPDRNQRHQMKSKSQLHLTAIMNQRARRVDSVPANIHRHIHDDFPLIKGRVPSKSGFITVDSSRNIWRLQANSSTHLNTKGRPPLYSLFSLRVTRTDLARPLYRKDIFFSGNVSKTDRFRSHPDLKTYVTSVTTIPGEMVFFEGECRLWRCLRFLPISCKDTLQEMTDFTLLKNSSFLLVCLGNVFVMLGFYVPIVFAVDLATSYGVTNSNAVFLISIMGVSNTIGRLLTGLAANRRSFDKLTTICLSMLLCGVSTITFTLFETFVSLSLLAAVFGISTGAFSSLTTSLISDLLGLEKLTNGYGLMTMFRGIATMMGTPIVGLIADYAKSIEASFYCGGAMILAGLLCHIVLKLCGSHIILLDQEEQMDEPQAQHRSQWDVKPELVSLQEMVPSSKKFNSSHLQISCAPKVKPTIAIAHGALTSV